MINNKNIKGMELLPYLFKTVYENSLVVKGGFTYEMLENELSYIPKNKQSDSINFCIKTRIYLGEISAIFQTINKLKNLGVGYEDKRYDRYYESIKNYREKLSDIVKEYKKQCQNPEALEPILDSIKNENYTIFPFPKPSTIINDLINTNKKVYENRQEFLKLFFNTKQSLSNQKLNFFRNLKKEMLKKLQLNSLL